VIYPYNKNQQDALFNFNLFRKLTSTCFEKAYCSSPGGTILYIQQLVCVMLKIMELVKIVSFLLYFKQFHYFQHDIYQLLYIQSSMSWWWAACSKHTEINYWNKLKVNGASFWFFLYGLLFSLFPWNETQGARLLVTTSCQCDHHWIVHVQGKFCSSGCSFVRQREHTLN
jgi:hypothetical protein